MKKTSWSRKQFRQLAGAGALAIIACLPGSSPASAQQTNAPAKPADSATDADTSDLVNWVDVGVGGTIVNGDKAQFQHLSGMPGNTAFGGINAFHYETNLGKKGVASIDGRGIFDNHDYDLHLDISHPDIGYIRGGFRQYRTYYDGSGGYLPSNGFYPVSSDNFLKMDRGTAFVEGGLTLPDWPVLKLRYEHDYRSGTEDSTEWGLTTLTGPGQTVSAASKRITPAYRTLDDQTDTVSFDIFHTIKNTDLGLGARYEWVRDADSKTVQMEPANGALSRTLTQKDSPKSDMFNAHALTDTRLSDKWELTSGYAYTLLHSIDVGNRLDNTGATTFDTRYANLGAASALEQYEMNLSLMYTPCENFYIVPSGRIEKESLQGTSLDNTITGVAVPSVATLNLDDESQVNAAESLDARYTGVTNWVFYVRGDWEENRDALGQSSGAITNTPFARQIFAGAWHQFSQQYSGGINWYPQRGLNFAAQYYHKIDKNSIENNTPAGSGAGAFPLSQYPGFMKEEDFITDDANFRVTWRPASQLTLVSRYDFQYSTVDMEGGANTTGGALQKVPISYTLVHMFGETVSWTPVNRFYMQAGLNYVLDSTHTGADSWPSTLGVVLKSQNDYWTFNGMAGVALDQKTDLRLTYTYYRAADYSNNSSVGLPLGAGSEETIVGATLGRQIRKNLRATLRYGYTSYRDQLFGGNIDYQAHTILATMQYRF